MLFRSGQISKESLTRVEIHTQRKRTRNYYFPLELLREQELQLTKKFDQKRKDYAKVLTFSLLAYNCKEKFYLILLHL